ncbi:MAG: NUDIX hydrolase [Oscillospiraceae bacterium]|nr:NUDIX hydrolase [Oscillospiraceae bacterium]
MDFTEHTLSHQRLYEGVLVNVDLDQVQLPNGQTGRREVVTHCPCVAVVPLNNDGTVTLVRQYRYPFSQVLTEIPAGKLDPGEQPRVGALRELREEVGAQVGQLIDLGELYTSPGFCQESIHLYLATELTYGDSCPDEDEFLEILRVPMEALVEQILDGQIRDAKTVAAVLKAALWLQREKTL